MPLIQCESCFKEKPIEEFPDLSTGTVCSQCAFGDPVTSSVRQSAAESALNEKARQMSRQIAELSGLELTGNNGKVRDILSQVYSNFGGAAGFASHLHSIIMLLSQRRPIPASVGHIMVNLMKLHAHIEQTEASIEASQLTDEQLKRAAETEVLKLVLDAANDPQKRVTLKSILSRHGMKLLDEKPEEVFKRATDDEIQRKIEATVLGSGESNYDDFKASELSDEDIANELSKFCSDLDD